MIKRFNIAVPKNYEKDGEEKTQWLNVGTLTHFPEKDDKKEGYRIELNMFPHLKLFVFPIKKRETSSADKAAEVQYEEMGGAESDKVDPQDIPFE